MKVGSACTSSLSGPEISSFDPATLGGAMIRAERYDPPN